MDRATCLVPRFRAIERWVKKVWGGKYPINNAVRPETRARQGRASPGGEHGYNGAQCRREHRQELLVWYSYVDAYCLELFEGKRHHAPCNFVRYWGPSLRVLHGIWRFSAIIWNGLYTSLPLRELALPFSLPRFDNASASLSRLACRPDGSRASFFFEWVKLGKRKKKKEAKRGAGAFEFSVWLLLLSLGSSEYVF